MVKVLNANLQFKNALIPLNLSEIVYIILHHIDAKEATPEQIHEWHLQNGWAGAGYNEYIRKDGTVYVLRGDNVGAHCTGHNSDAYGIAFEGNFNVEFPTQLQIISAVERLKYHKQRFPKLRGIDGHCKFGPTSCPGKYFSVAHILDELSKIPEVPQKAPEQVTGEKAIDVLVSKGLINNPEVWKAKDLKNTNAPLWLFFEVISRLSNK